MFFVRKESISGDPQKHFWELRSLPSSLFFVAKSLRMTFYTKEKDQTEMLSKHFQRNLRLNNPFPSDAASGTAAGGGRIWHGGGGIYAAWADRWAAAAAGRIHMHTTARIFSKSLQAYERVNMKLATTCMPAP